MIKSINALEERIISNIRAVADVAVVGLSGGADSTLVAILCTKALGAENVVGIHMPYGTTDKETFNSRSKKLANEALKIPNHEIPVRNIADSITSAVENAVWYQERTLNVVNRGNARSRARMCVLYAMAHELGTNLNKRVRVMGTGNLSEDYIGYDTKGGDALADIFPIGELFKSEVYQMLDHYKSIGLITEDLIARVPSAGLWEGQTDEAELGYSYNEMEAQIKKILSHKTYPHVSGRESEVWEFVVNRHNANKHKHEAPPVVKLRDLCD